MKDIFSHEHFMQRCLDIAVNGLGTVSPNPLVGSVIVHDNKIIGEGYHIRYGDNHAEVNAVNSVENKNLLKDSTLYVNLEPCSHWGKTPPCAKMIIENKIPRVVAGIADINPEVAGKGIEMLKNAGVSVVTNVLRDECTFVNRRFLTYYKYKRPYIILKWAMTLDGFIDIERDKETPIGPTWINSEKLKPLVHKWRTEEDAIITGTNTALKDDPALTAREWAGKNPLRIYIDKNNRIPVTYKLFDGSADTLIVTSKAGKLGKNVDYFEADFTRNIIPQLLEELYNRKVQSLIVEGGKILLESFIKMGLWDEARVFTGNKRFLKGITAPDFPFYPDSEKIFDNDRLSFYVNEKIKLL